MSPFEVSDDMGVWKGSFVGVEVMVQFWFGKTSIITKIWVIFCCYPCPLEGLLCVCLCVWVGISISLPFYIWKVVPSDPNTAIIG